jgi:cytochrome c553
VTNLLNTTLLIPDK